jgi:ATP-dependent Lhr-like helicase
VVPTSVAPITFFVREDADWMAGRPAASRAPHLPGLSRQAGAVLQHLHHAGASFFPDVVRATRLLKAEVETALWELVAAGLVTADGFDNLRALIDPRRRSGHGSGRAARPRHSAGRWSLLHAGTAAGSIGPTRSHVPDASAALRSSSSVSCSHANPSCRHGAICW